ncbi:MAG: YIP1 family protein [Candidatus Gottesmanbacteria bacterium]
MRGSILRGCIGFIRSSIGLITTPYETYRRIVNHGSLWELVPLGVLLSCYFAISSLVKTAAFRPYILTKHFILLAMVVLATYSITVLLLWGVSKLLRGKGDIRSLGIAWGYTLIPTLLWFLATSLLYVIFPPPRTGRPLGILFSALYLSFSTALFFWKAMLSYLTLRFGMRLDLWRIIAVFFIVGGVMAIYSIGMYRLGIFKVPFI